VLIQLASGVTVNEGPPFTVTADPTNTSPIVCAYIGSVVFVLQPGQSVEIVVTETGVRIINLSPDQPLYAIGWDGVPVEIPPGGDHEFGVLDTEIDRDRALSHIDDLVGRLGEAFPEALEQAEGPIDLLEMIGEPREDQGGFQSNSDGGQDGRDGGDGYPD